MDENTASIIEQLSVTERHLFSALNTPAAVQSFLDATTYSSDPFYRCPVRVLRERCANCLDGALFAAACLRQAKHPPLIIDLLPEPGTDDDHLIAVYRQSGFWGAVAKSNFAGLRYREPIYRTTRELVLSYFEQFYNLAAMKTLRAYTRPFRLATMDKCQWMTTDAGMDQVEYRLNDVKPIMLFTSEITSRFLPMDKRTYDAGLAGANVDGLFKPGMKKNS
jgi:hypothetical protein